MGIFDEPIKRWNVQRLLSLPMFSFRQFLFIRWSQTTTFQHQQQPKLTKKKNRKFQTNAQFNHPLNYNRIVSRALSLSLALSFSEFIKIELTFSSSWQAFNPLSKYRRFSSINFTAFYCCCACVCVCGNPRIVTLQHNNGKKANK